MDERQVVGDHLEDRSAPQGADMNDAAAHDPQHRQRLLERIALAADENGDVSRCGPVTAARHRRIERFGARAHDPLAEAPDFALLRRAHLQPQLVGRQAFEHALRLLEDLGADGR